jgi:hypothetical protein
MAFTFWGMCTSSSSVPSLRRTCNSRGHHSAAIAAVHCAAHHMHADASAQQWVGEPFSTISHMQPHLQGHCFADGRR